MIKQLRKRFILVMMLSLVIVFALLIAAINIVYSYNERKSIDARLEMIYNNGGSFPDGKQMRDGAQAEGEPRPKDSLDAGEPSNAAAPGEDEHSGTLGSAITPDTRFETSFFFVSVNADGSIADINHNYTASVTEDQIRQYATQILSGDDEYGAIGTFRYRVYGNPDGTYSIVAINCYQQIRQGRLLLLGSLSVGAAAVLLVYILVLLMSRRVTRPVEESVRKQRQFITNAGHELKTPITIISANLDVLQMQNTENKWLDSIRNQTRRLSALVKNLLELAKLQESGDSEIRADFNLSETVDEVTQSFQVYSETTGQTLDASIQSGIQMKGVREDFYKLVSILLDNAFKYSNNAAPIRLRLAKQRKITLSVYNTCDNISPKEVSHLFERFYRADESRSRETGGSGIGLSMAQAITEKYKGKISAVSEEGKSSTFTAVF